MRALSFILLVFICGCATDPYKGVRHKDDTIPFEVRVETSDAGAKIEVNNEYMGEAPMTLTIYGDDDGTFHGSGLTVIQALPVKKGQHVQTKVFRNGGIPFGPGEDRIPKRIYFDLNLVPVGDKKTIDLNIK